MASRPGSFIPQWSCALWLAATASSTISTGVAGQTDSSSKLEDTGRRAGEYLRAHYLKREFRIPMRDGVQLYTVAFVPRDSHGRHPLLLERTPYGLAPYGEDQYPAPVGGPLFHYAREGYIFVYQDVRGRYRSEGEFIHLRPYKQQKRGPDDIDESTDAYDTIDWLLRALPTNNGRVGVLGLSYAGFYAAVAAIDAHPALKCVSPQAPATDWFMGDDFRHNGALFVLHAFRFLSGFSSKAPDLPQDGYSFFLGSGSLDHLGSRYLDAREPFWQELISHDRYDAFWKARSLIGQLSAVRPAVLVVGGWYDAENLYGALNLHRHLAHEGRGLQVTLAMGPWAHSAWSWQEGRRLGPLDFGAATAESFREKIERPFLRRCLLGEQSGALPGAYVFETGAARWREFDSWPPPRVREQRLYFKAGGGLGFSTPQVTGFDEYVSDPARPVPYTAEVTSQMPSEYMVEDQRFAATRPDVLVYRSDTLDSNATLAGPIEARLLVSTSGTDSDWIVKLIDVHPDGYQQLVRGEPMPGRFHAGFDKPRALVPNEPTPVRFSMPDVFHTFKPGHRIMVQVQSSWFPLVERNPQTFVRIASAVATDYRKATQRLYWGGERGSALVVNLLPEQR